jgi:hypothetical protein
VVITSPISSTKISAAEAGVIFAQKKEPSRKQNLFFTKLIHPSGAGLSSNRNSCIGLVFTSRFID